MLFRPLFKIAILTQTNGRDRHFRTPPEPGENRPENPSDRAIFPRAFSLYRKNVNTVSLVPLKILEMQIEWRHAGRLDARQIVFLREPRSDRVTGRVRK